MRDRVLVKQFKDDAGLAFIEVIRRAGDPVRTQEIKAELIEAGVSKADVDRWWKTLQPSLKEHPRITCPRSGVYEWSFTTESSHDSLEKLTVQAGKRSAGRAWLVEAFTDNISDTLALVEKSGAGRKSHGLSSGSEKGDAVGRACRLSGFTDCGRRLWRRHSRLAHAAGAGPATHPLGAVRRDGRVRSRAARAGGSSQAASRPGRTGGTRGLRLVGSRPGARRRGQGGGRGELIEALLADLDA